MNPYSKIIQRIIQEQENIIGQIAIEQAQKVNGLTVDWQKKTVQISGDNKKVLEELVVKYKGLFGQASVEVCKDAVKGLKSQITNDMLPTVLQ